MSLETPDWLSVHTAAEEQSSCPKFKEISNVNLATESKLDLRIIPFNRKEVFLELEFFTAASDKYRH